jgi:WD40 repeat protein
VCQGCRLTLERCPRPAPHHVQLELPPGFNISQIEESGRLALAVNKRGQSKVILLPVGQVLRTIGRNVVWPQLGRSGQLVLPVLDHRRLFFARTIRIEEAGDGSVRRVAGDYNGEPVQIIVSGDQAVALIVGAEGTLYAMDLAGDRGFGSILLDRGELLRVTAAAASRDSGLLALGRTGSVLLYWLQGGSPAGQIPVESRKLKWLGLASHRLAAITHDGTLEAWDLEPGPRGGEATAESPSVAEQDPKPALRWRHLLSRPLGADVVYNVSVPDREVALREVKASLSPDGRLLAVRHTYQPRIAVTDLESGEPLPLSGHGYLVTALQFTRGGAMLLSADIGGRLVYWPCRRGRVVAAPAS